MTQRAWTDGIDSVADFNERLRQMSDNAPDDNTIPEDHRHEEVREWAGAFSDDILLADGLEDAFIGVAERCSQPPLAVYDADKCIQVMMRDGMDYDEATEFFSFNTLGAWVGEMTPLFLWRYKRE
jgi:hypothetical protein